MLAPTLSHFGTTPEADPLLLVLGYSGWVVLALLGGFLLKRPAGGGQLVAVFSDDADRNLSVGVLSIELAAVLSFCTALALVVVSRMKVALTEPHVLTFEGLVGISFSLVAVVLWGAAWVAEGLSVTTSNPMRSN